MDAHKLWSNKTTRNSLGYFTANLRGTKVQDTKIIGTFLYYARAVYCTMLPAFKKLAEQQSIPNKNMEAAITHFLDYSATNPPTIIQYKASDTILYIDSDT